MDNIASKFISLEKFLTNDNDLSSIALTLFFLIVIVTTIYFYRSSRLHQDHKFNVYIQMLSAFGAIALAITLLLTVMYRNEDREESSFHAFTQLFGQVDDHIDVFINHPEMNYFYNELYGRQSMNYGVPYKRNRDLEYQITNKLFNTIASFLDYFQTHKGDTSENLNIIRTRVNNIMGLHVKSKMFLENWKIYKSTVATELTIQYMKENFNV